MPDSSAQNHGTSARATPPLRRDILPIPDPQHVGLTTYDAKDPDTTYPPITMLRPPEGAPNILIVLIDDVGFGASTAFGGPCNTPVADRLAANGLKLNRFHTTALCSPTRQAMLTGRNHHSVGMGGITEIATSAPGYSSIRPKDKAPIAETLRLNGYSTSQFGKCHEVPVWEVSPVGPFGQWPTGSGFEHFYGFIGGEANQYYPGLYEGTRPVEPEKTPEEGYTLTEDLADRAITWVSQQKALTPDKPFFMYFAPGATHAPHHVPAQWSDKYKGKFDEGWDVLREQILPKQKDLGVVPPDAELTARHDEIPAWDDMPDALKPVLARQMEIYAGFLEQTDYEVGRLIDAIDDLGALDDTLIYYIFGDNGASAEGTPKGCFNEMTTLNGLPDIETDEFLLAKIDDFGTPNAYNHYAVGWAHALCTPYQWTKQVASHWGGTRNGTVVHWPAGLAGKGESRNQFHHVIDVAPTILEAAGIPAPTIVNSIQQAPLEGVSMLSTLRGADAPETHTLQYFEMFGNRGVYHKGWTAVTKHRTPWLNDQPALDDDVWELYGPDDWTQAHDLAASQPDKLAALQRLWLIQAVKYNVVPIDDRSFERFKPRHRGPSAADHRYHPDAVFRHATAGELCAQHQEQIPLGDRADRRAGGGRQWRDRDTGRRCGRLVVVCPRRKAEVLLQLLRIEYYFVTADEPIPAGRHEVRMEFGYDGDGLGKGGTVTLFYDDRVVGSGRVDQTEPMAFSADEACDVGSDTGSPTSTDYGPHGNKFSGAIDRVIIDIGQDSHDHLVTAQDKLNIAMSRQ